MNSSVVLFFAYFAFPLVSIIAKLSSINISRNWIDIVWICLAFLASLKIVISREVFILKKFRTIFCLVLLLLALISIVKFVIPFITTTSNSLTPYALEFKPIFYIAVSIIWIAAFGVPRKQTFILMGVILSLVLIFDFVLESAIQGSIARTYGSGEINYDACLLLVVLCLMLDNNDMKKKSWYLILLGLLVTFSRTAILTISIILIFFAKLSIRKKITLTAIVVFFIILSFIIRNLSYSLGTESLNQMDRLWMWKAAYDLFTQDPMHFLFGYTVSNSLPVKIPSQLEWLWNEQEDEIKISGIYPFHFHAFWLRVTITWGIVFFLSYFSSSLYLLLKSKNNMLRALIVLILIEGVTMGVFYLSNVSIPLILALAYCLNSYKSVTFKAISNNTF